MRMLCAGEAGSSWRRPPERSSVDGSWALRMVGCWGKGALARGVAQVQGPQSDTFEIISNPQTFAVSALNLGQLSIGLGLGFRYLLHRVPG